MGLALTYSTLTRRRIPRSQRPYSSPLSSAAPTTPRQTSAVSRRLMKPGPATSAVSTRGSIDIRPARSAAISRGATPAAFASTIAALVAMSPCEGSRGGSTETLASESPRGRRPSSAIVSRLAVTRVRMSAKASMSWSSDGAARV